MRSTYFLLACLICFAASAPVYWIATIPNGDASSPIAREFHSLTNIPGTPFNIMFGGVEFNSSEATVGDTWLLDTSMPSWKPLNPASSPAARAYVVTGVANGEVILFGGMNLKSPRTFFSDVWRFNLSSNTWTQDDFVLPSVLLPRSFAAGLVVGNSLFVFGGFVQALQTVTNDLWSYNIASKQWALLSSNGQAGAPRPRQGHSANFYNDTMRGPSILFFGGYNNTGGMSDTWQFIISTGVWIQITKDGDTSGPSPRWGQSVIFTASPPTLVIFGGTFVGGSINPYYNDVWTLQYNGSAWNWTNLLPDGNMEGPQRRGGQATVLSLGKSFTYGGYASFIGLLNDVWQLVNF
jgi:hypothetical protein